MECGRTQATLNNTVIQPDQDDFLLALLKMTPTAVGNIAVRQAPAYSSQTQGSVEWFHRTLLGQVRALKLQLENNYGTHLTSKHPIMPWMVKHAAYLLNRYAVHAGGNASYYRRWNKEHMTPICEFGETVLHMLPTAKHRPKMEARFFQAIWLGKDTSTNENILGISKQIVKARTIRRQTKPEKYNKQMMDIIDSTSMTTPTPTSFVKQETSTAETQTQQAPELPIPRSSQQTSTPTITDVPMATSPTYNRRTPLPIPTTAKRDVADDIAEGSSAKQPRTGQQQTAAQRPEATQEPDKTRLWASAITVTTKRGDKVKAVSNEDQQEAETEKILLEPWVTNTEGLNTEQTTEGMKQEIRSMKAQQVYTEVSYNTLTQEQRNKIIKSRWVPRQKGNTVRARIVAKGYTEDVKDTDDIYASTPIFCVLRLLLRMSLSNRWIVRAGDIILQQCGRFNTRSGNFPWITTLTNVRQDHCCNHSWRGVYNIPLPHHGRQPNKAIMVSINIPLRKVTLLSHHRLTLFLRNFLMEQFQLEAGQILKSAEQEMDNQRTWTMSTTRTWTTIMDHYSWPNGFAWSCNQLRHIETICNSVDTEWKKRPTPSLFNRSCTTQAMEFSNICQKRDNIDAAGIHSRAQHQHSFNTSEGSQQDSWTPSIESMGGWEQHPGRFQQLREDDQWIPSTRTNNPDASGWIWMSSTRWANKGMLTPSRKQHWNNNTSAVTKRSKSTSLWYVQMLFSNNLFERCDLTTRSNREAVVRINMVHRHPNIKALSLIDQQIQKARVHNTSGFFICNDIYIYNIQTSLGKRIKRPLSKVQQRVESIISASSKPAIKKKWDHEPTKTWKV